VVTSGTVPEIRCTFGLRLMVDRRLEDIDVRDFDALAVPGGFSEYGFYDDAYAEAVSDLIRGFDALNKPIASICVGALPVARSGILAGKNATTYHRDNGLRRTQLADFKANVQDAPIVCDGRIMTSTGPSTAVDVAFALLETLTSRENADRIRYLMGFPSVCQVFNEMETR
jgi:protein deglycase